MGWVGGSRLVKTDQGQRIRPQLVDPGPKLDRARLEWPDWNKKPDPQKGRSRSRRVCKLVRLESQAWFNPIFVWLKHVETSARQDSASRRLTQVNSDLVFAFRGHHRAFLGHLAHCPTICFSASNQNQFNLTEAFDRALGAHGQRRRSPTCLGTLACSDNQD